MFPASETRAYSALAEADRPAGASLKVIIMRSREIISADTQVLRVHSRARLRQNRRGTSPAPQRWPR